MRIRVANPQIVIHVLDALLHQLLRQATQIVDPPAVVRHFHDELAARWHATKQPLLETCESREVLARHPVRGSMHLWRSDPLVCREKHIVHVGRQQKSSRSHMEAAQSPLQGHTERHNMVGEPVGGCEKEVPRLHAILLLHCSGNAMGRCVGTSRCVVKVGHGSELRCRGHIRWCRPAPGHTNLQLCHRCWIDACGVVESRHFIRCCDGDLGAVRELADTSVACTRDRLLGGDRMGHAADLSIAQC